jgi:hypothetical protein
LAQCFAIFGKDLQFQRHELVVVGEAVVIVVVVLGIQMYSIEIPFEVVNV